ncbi:MAG: hypothetical protein V1824_04485, partial [archaeon]
SLLGGLGLITILTSNLILYFYNETFIVSFLLLIIGLVLLLIAIYKTGIIKEYTRKYSKFTEILAIIIGVLSIIIYIREAFIQKEFLISRVHFLLFAIYCVIMYKYNRLNKDIGETNL